MTPKELISVMLARQAEPSVPPWLGKAAVKLHSAPDARTLFACFSEAVRKTGNGPLKPLSEDLAYAQELFPGWNPVDWTLDQAARVYLLLSLPASLMTEKMIDALYKSADLGESLAILKGLPLLPDAGSHLEVARMAARSNAKPQFEAVAIRNPYPMAHFDEAAWNQLIVKAIFIDSPLQEIVGVEVRANGALNGILLDLIRERSAAGKTVHPWLYRCIGIKAEAPEFTVLEEVLETGSASERQNAYFGLAGHPDSRARELTTRFRKMNPALCERPLA